MLLYWRAHFTSIHGVPLGLAINDFCLANFLGESLMVHIYSMESFALHKRLLQGSTEVQITCPVPVSAVQCYVVLYTKSQTNYLQLSLELHWTEASIR